MLRLVVEGKDLMVMKIGSILSNMCIDRDWSESLAGLLSVERNMQHSSSSFGPGHRHDYLRHTALNWIISEYVVFMFFGNPEMANCATMTLASFSPYSHRPQSSRTHNDGNNSISWRSL